MRAGEGINTWFLWNLGCSLFLQSYKKSMTIYPKYQSDATLIICHPRWPNTLGSPVKPRPGSVGLPSGCLEPPSIEEPLSRGRVGLGLHHSTCARIPAPFFHARRTDMTSLPAGARGPRPKQRSTCSFSFPNLILNCADFTHGCCCSEGKLWNAHSRKVVDFGRKARAWTLLEDGCQNFRSKLV